MRSASKHFQDGRLGTVFGGTRKIGITIEQLLALEAQALSASALRRGSGSRPAATLASGRGACDAESREGRVPAHE